MEADVIIQYDFDASRRNFEENFERVQDGVWMYVDYGNIAMPDMYDLITIYGNSSKVDLIDLLGYGDNEWTRDELIEEVYGQFDFWELLEELPSHNVNAHIHCSVFTTTGYSQGDWAQVVVPHSIAKVWGVSVEKAPEGMQKLIDQCFWDAPVWGRVELFAGHDFDFEFYEMDLPEYPNWDYGIDDYKTDVLKWIRNRFKNAAAVEKIVKTVEEAFPTEIRTPNY